MYIFLIVVHVFVCLVLILVVLLQAGRGGGLSDMMGGGQPQSVFGTQTNQFMTRATEICAILFVITSLSLGIISTQRGKSLMERRRLSGALKQSIPGVPASGTESGLPVIPTQPGPTQNPVTPASAPAATQTAPSVATPAAAPQAATTAPAATEKPKS
ncbi:MAG TPA: preprotein translocase subunit SecG [Candidatus Eisenbacteria bacterium]|jgi:preprotein translocase subunit SecG|nr:preprotein translocase subunit SecG [Candidatus Eisenbacteria bacterium]